MPSIVSINDVSWTRLNVVLLKCKDTTQLQRWLAETIPTGRLNRALRIHGRLNAVRRAEELVAIKKGTQAALAEPKPGKEDPVGDWKGGARKW